MTLQATCVWFFDERGDDVDVDDDDVVDVIIKNLVVAAHGTCLLKCHLNSFLCMIAP